MANEKFVQQIEKDFSAGVKHNKRSVDKLASSFGITDNTLIKELTELAIVNVSRRIAYEKISVKSRYEKIVALYNLQPNLSHRTSQSISLQQYSTPAPIAFLMGEFIKKEGDFRIYFEPTAGNGLLTIALPAKNFVVNELDEVRLQNLRKQGYDSVTSKDASKEFLEIKSYDGIVANPPFGKLENPIDFHGYEINSLEQLIAIRTLDTMRDNGKAAIIIGGHTKWDSLGNTDAEPKVKYVNWLPSPRRGMCIPPFGIFIKKEFEGNEKILNHELKHWEQWKRLGTWNFYKQYFAEYFKHGYDKMPLEIEARFDESEYCKENYTECVKQGLASLEISSAELERLNGLISENDLGRIQSGKNRTFLNYLNHFYHVKDIVNINGDLYAKQGTQFDIRLILIDGRKPAPEGVAPLFNPAKDKTVNTFDELYTRIMQYVNNSDMKKSNEELEAEALELELALLSGPAVIAAPGHNYKGYEVEISGWDWGNDKVTYKFTISKDGKYILGLKGFPFRTHEETFAAADKEIDNFISHGEDLGSPYIPASKGCFVLNINVPDAMAYETQHALEKIKRDVGGDMAEYVRKKLKYEKKIDLCNALAAEQIDAVAMAIYNIEFRNQAMIIGDQTGIGKGRVAAAMIRYGMMNDIIPIFFTEKPNLFSDIYRDLNEIGSDDLSPIRLLERVEKHETIDEETGAKITEDIPIYSKREIRVPAGAKQVVPFIINGRSALTEIKDSSGNLIYQGLQKTELDAILKSRKLPKRFNLVLTTYSQFNSPVRMPIKPSFILSVAKGNIIIMDESHNASGDSQTGKFLADVVRDTKGAVFLSATFAKRPDNMPIYAMKTAISDANLTADELIEAITRGGVALQEILAAQLVREGQMLRRERGSEGIEVNYISLDAKEKQHRKIADTITDILRNIIVFQEVHIKPYIKQLDKKIAAQQKEAVMRQGTQEAGINNTPFFSKIFNVINQMLFSIKAEDVALRAIKRLKEGKKPIIAFASTMESFLNEMEIESSGTINADFAEVLKRGLDGVLRYSIIGDKKSKQEHKKIELADLPIEARSDYAKILKKIKEVSTGITISPIDVILQTIRAAGYTVAEVTGRKSEVQVNMKTMKGIILPRKKVLVNDAFRMFNDNETDVLLINQAGATGASAHAIATKKVPENKIKQRVMIMLQPELDINKEVQKRGRINRTGQKIKPIYDYINSAIPAEKRLMMMLQKKMKSLDANTTSNQKQSESVLHVADFLNKYGDKVVVEYLKENPAINKLLLDPLGLNKASADKKEDFTPPENAAHKVSGKVAVLSTDMQEKFYSEITDSYNDLVEYLKQTGEYDLEVEAMNLEAETVKTRVIKGGKGGKSSFGDDSVMETVKVNVLKKPMKKSEVEKLIAENLNGKTPEKYVADIKSAYSVFAEAKLNEDIAESNEKFERLIRDAKDRDERETLQDQKNEAGVIIRQHSENRQQSTNDIFDYFKVGWGYNYPVQSYSEGMSASKAVFLGFDLDKKRPNPYAPSAIKIKLAIADSNRYIALPTSYYEKILAIQGASGRLADYEQEEILSQWDELSKKATVNRAQRFIITGNILQAFSDHKGKLISYTTTKEGEIKKGILLPDNWDPSKQLKGKVTVPIIQALKILKGMGAGSVMTLSSDIYIVRDVGDIYKVFVPLSKQAGGVFYLDEDILNIVENHIFEKAYDRYAGGHKMKAEVTLKKLPELIDVLQDKFNLSASIAETQFEMIERPERKKEKEIILPPIVEERRADQFDEEAEALALELELLTL